ncbi:hypothetical protein C0991_002817, partial [Blastosporella zonata]
MPYCRAPVVEVDDVVERAGLSSFRAGVLRVVLGLQILMHENTHEYPQTRVVHEEVFHAGNHL